MINAYQPTSDLVHEQVALYEATDGREGGTLEGRPVVILTTIGAKTGNFRKNPVMRIKDGDTYVKDGDTYVAVASNGGAGSNPSWYRNLSAHPEVSLQDGATVHWLHESQAPSIASIRGRATNQYGPGAPVLGRCIRRAHHDIGSRP
jgi:deazaflavin-dependent oxidoreductase (nitroreductase family)